MSRTTRCTFAVSTALLAALLTVEAGEKLAERWQKKLDAAESVYQTAKVKADNARFYALQKANGERLKVMKAVLTDATKAGDFDAASTIKERMVLAEMPASLHTKPKNTVKFQGHEFALIGEKATWHIAKRICEEMGGHLAIVDTPEKRQFAATLCADDTTWLGADDEVQEGVWRWTDGRIISDRSWMELESQEINHFLCFQKNGGRWFDAFSEYRMPFLCEWD